jgi:hypothetical protein
MDAAGAMKFEVPPPSVEKIEWEIAVDVAKKAAIAGPVVVLGLGIWRGPDAALAAVLAIGVALGSLLLSAAVLGWTARRAPHALAGVALLSFLGRLALITAVGAGIKALEIVDWPVFCFTLIGAYLLLLFWELRSISLTLAYPGLKPKPGSS